MARGEASSWVQPEAMDWAATVRLAAGRWNDRDERVCRLVGLQPGYAAPGARTGESSAAGFSESLFVAGSTALLSPCARGDDYAIRTSTPFLRSASENSTGARLSVISR